MRNGWGLAVAAVMTALVGCSEDVPISTEADVAYGEYVERVSIAEAQDDFLIVGRPEVLAANADVILQPIADGFMPSQLTRVRLAVFAPEDVGAFLDSVAVCEAFDGSCVPDQPHYSERNPLPYGYGIDVEQWRVGSACLLAGRTDCEVATIDGAAFGAWGGLTVLWVDNEVPCASGDQCPATPLDHVRDLVASGTLPGTRVSVVGAAPEPELVNTVVQGFTHHTGDHLGSLPVVVGSDGLPACVMRETLPDHGPITRCEQLDEFGRSFERVDDDGREVCLIDPQPEPPMGTSGPPGFYFTEAHPDGYPHMALVLDAEPIPGSILEWRCERDYWTPP